MQDIEHVSPVGFREAVRYWIKLGFINFGGPAGQIAIMHRDLVDRKQWIGEPEFLRALNFCMVLPGPEAQQLATYIGWKLHGVRGGLIAGLGFILPSIVILLALSYLLAAHRDVTWVSGLLFGVQPVIVAIVVQAVVRVGRRTLRHWSLIVLAAAAFVGIYVLGVPFPVIVLIAALSGLAVARWMPALVRTGGHGGHATTGQGAEPPVSKGPPSLWRLLGIVGVFAVLWAVPVGLLVLTMGSDSVYTDVAMFFTGAAFVTFGGAYAVLSYIAEAGVNVYGWLGPGEMVNGLALAESTPGPLIMVTEYVGFMAGWRFPGDLPPFVSGTLAAIVTTYVTFLPCFLFIFAGAPYVEALAGNRRVQGALLGVTAAIVGVILNLAVFFASHVLIDERRPDWAALAIAALGLAALLKLRWQVHTLVLAGALVGLASVPLKAALA